MTDEPTSPSVRLRRGHEVTPWPWVKLRLARAEIETLGSMIDVWNLEHPARLSATIEAEGHRIVFRVSETPEAPLMQWAAHLGAAVSNMRAALGRVC